MNAHVNNVAKAAPILIEASYTKPRAKSDELYVDTFKRALDILAVVLMAPVVVPVVIVLAIVIAMDGKSPFYIQKRVGLNGKVFRMFKLRSMIANADAALEAYLQSNPQARAEWNAKQKLNHDPRITKVGNFIRKSSLDELPQLMNVLIGDMSLVGPRPMMCEQRAIYPGTEYYAMRPGITGYWQISDRNECDFAERATFDANYYRDRSLQTDVKVLLGTVGVVLKATGK